MNVRIWGARGSRPSPGPFTVRYGGHTTCLSVPLDDRTTLVLDAGTGIVELGRTHSAGDHTYLILLTHPHWDHIQGFPFFSPRVDPSTRIRVLCPGRPDWGRMLLDQMDGIRFPVRADQMDADVAVVSAGVDRLLADHGVELSVIPAHHPGACHGYRIEHSGSSMVFLPDNELRAPGAGSSDFRSFVDFARGARLLVHDAQYDPIEIEKHRGWGHSCHLDACDLACEAGVERLILFHHDPSHTDDDVDLMLESARAHVALSDPGMCVEAARGE